MVTDIALGDYTTVTNALMGGPSAPATVSVNVQWATGKRIRDSKNGFAGTFSQSIASIEWSAKEDGFTYVSDPASTSVNGYSLVGRERNGVFF